MRCIYFIAVLLTIIISSCEYETDTPIPGYITINSIDLKHEKALGITDAWVYIGSGNIQGVYELPATFPVIADGETKIEIRPGIKVNGISGTRSYYPYYEPFIKTVNIEAGEPIILEPVCNYVDWAEKTIIDDFEQGTIAFEISNSSDTAFQISELAFEGKYAGKITIDTDRSKFEAYSTEQFTIPDFDNYTGMFLEMNFKCEEEIEIGLIINDPSVVTVTDVIYLNPTTEWKKIYIDLYNPLINYQNGYQFKLYLKAKLDVSSGRESADIFVDDIKMITK